MCCLKSKKKYHSIYIDAREGIKAISQQPPETTGFNPSTSNSHFTYCKGSILFP